MDKKTQKELVDQELKDQIENIKTNLDLMLAVNDQVELYEYYVIINKLLNQFHHFKEFSITLNIFLRKTLCTVTLMHSVFLCCGRRKYYHTHLVPEKWPIVLRLEFPQTVIYKCINSSKVPNCPVLKS